MGLETYRRKRDFDRTGEPRGRTRAGKGPLHFVVQKHAASRLHYDFRLELDGVLKSWAVPKGPSLDPADKRLAVHVEDHPMDYEDFEGVIPEGEYGGGTVMVWDRGTWIPDGDARRAYERGRLDFRLDGEKLKGAWHLVRMKSRDDGNDWLLIKGRDEEAQADGDAILERSESVLSGRSMQEIKRAKDRIWTSEEGEVTKAQPEPGTVEGARDASMPKAIEAQLATLVSDPPEGDDWLHEMKLDGYRLLCHRDGDAVRLITRNDKNWTDRFPEVAEAVKKLRSERAILDGEVVVLDENGVSHFQALQNALSAAPGKRRLHYFVFDLPYLDGVDLRRAALEDRKELLKALLSGVPEDGVLRYSDHVRGHGEAFFEKACASGLEGIISKRADAPYRGGRGRDWRKTKCVKRQEFVIVGYTEPKGSRTGFGALLLAVRANGGLRSAGRVGTGFTDRTLEDLHARLRKLERKTPPIEDPPGGAAARDVHWVQPELIAEVAFTEWTADGQVRHPSFQGLREDKEPEEIVRERPAAKTAGVEIAGVALTNPDRVLYPEQGITKRTLAEYYEAVADRLLPHLRDRPLTLVRCPSGRQKNCFFQKHAGDGIPESVPRVEVPEDDGPAQYMMINDLSSVIALVQLGVLEFHVWGSRADRLDRPDRLVFDLDPDPQLRWTEVMAAALLLRERLSDLGLESFVKTTGGKGLHVVAPIDRRSTWNEARSFTHAIASEFAAAWPDRFTDVMTKSRRKGRIYVDYLRNGFNATAIAAYSTRARDGAPVAMPMAWDELEKTKKRPTYDIAGVPELVRERGDPWKELSSIRQSITKAMLREVGA